MTIPVTLNTISNLQDTTTAQTNINANSAAITGAFSTALNVTGDQMKGNLDMNSNQILNLPAPATANSPVRLQDVVLPATALPALVSGNNVFTGTNSFGAITNISLPLSAARLRETSGLNLYVNASTGSNSNNGTSATSAFSTINYAVNYFYSNYDLAGVSVAINVAAGTYNETIIIESLDRGAPADVSLVGAGSATTIINAPSNACLAIKDYGTVGLQGFTLTGSSTAVSAINCGQFSICDINSDMVFGTFSLNGSSHLTCSQNSSININSNYTISGAATYHYLVSTGGLLEANSITVTMPTTLSFNTFGYFYQGARGNLGGLTFTGSGATTSTGTKFFIGDQAWIGMGGLDANLTLPGNASGVYYRSNYYDFNSAANTLTTLNSLANYNVGKGYLAVVSDATATTPGTTVTGGGANTVLTWFNGSSWRILGS